jgi:predicted short-subunit dehydrogenase-like oxidoreductase (DUF2520 family)
VTRSLRVVGAGRAGGSLMRALARAGWEVRPPIGRDDPTAGAARDVDLLVIATPDAAIGEVAAAVEPVASTVVAHLAGSLGLDVLGVHDRRAAIHPLVSLPAPEVGAERLVGAWFAVAGDSLVDRVVLDLDGRSFVVADADRALYHGAACVAANHLVALLGSVERLAGRLGIPGEAYLDLAAGALANVRDLGPAAALTGPAARGDWLTIERHRAAIIEAFPPDVAAEELAAYDALVALARRLVL